MRRSVLCWVLCVLGMVAVRARANCLEADVSIEPAHSRIELRLQLPPGVLHIALASLDPFHRHDLWRSPDSSAVIDDTGITASDPAQRRLLVSMDVRRNLPQIDRAYSPFFRFADGTVAVYSAMFAAAERSAIALCPRYVPVSGEQVIGYGHALSRPLQPGVSAGTGYVAFGNPQVTRSHSLLLVSDHGVPEVLHKRVATAIPEIVDFYSHRMGTRQLPTVFLYVMPGDGGTRSYHGDHLDASITLGLLGAGWETPDDASLKPLLGFVAHELFHSWNSSAPLGSPEGEALLAKEGGAEFARILATAHLLHLSESEWLKEVAASFNACLYGQRDGISLRTALQDHSPGSLPYNCGVPMMLVLAAAANPRDSTVGYFESWTRLIARRSKDHAVGYRWQDLLPDRTSTMPQILERAVKEPGAYSEALGQALAANGFAVTPVKVLNADARMQISGQLMAHLMRADCAGSISFWPEPDGFRLDTPLPACKTLRPGATVNVLLGEHLSDTNLWVLADRVAQRCASGLPVEVGYADQSQPSKVHCAARLQALPHPVDIARTTPKVGAP